MLVDILTGSERLERVTELSLRNKRHRRRR